MAGKGNPIRLGIFIFLGFVLILTTIFLIGNKESLFSRTFIVRAYFPSVEGLRNGASVRLSGIDVGSVKDIRIVNNALGRIEVILNLNADIKKYLRADATATIETEGLVGNKVVTLQIGSEKELIIRENAQIKGIPPLGFGAIMEETKTTIGYTREMTKNLAEIIEKVNRGEGSIGKFINNNDIYNNTNSLIVTADRSLTSISNKLDSMAIVVNSLLTGVENTLDNVDHVIKNVDNVILNVDNVILDIDKIIKDVRTGKGIIGELFKEGSALDTSFHAFMENVIYITATTKTSAEKLEENMEALKRNWLFKSYFDQRGVYDRTSYEKQLDTYIQQINDRLRKLDERIERLQKMKPKEKQTQQ